MTGRTHVMGGIASLWLLLPAIPPDSIPLAIIFAALGSLLPDLDAGASLLSNATVGGVAPLKPVSRLLRRRLGHRGPLHSLLASLFVTLGFGLPLALLWDPSAGAGLALGYLSHVLLDACTKSGVPLLWPDPKRMHLVPPRLRLATGSPAEDALFVLVSLAVSALLLTNLYRPDHATIPNLSFQDAARPELRRA